MLHNYLTVAIRHIIRQRMYMLANLLGLSIGLTCLLLAWLYIAHEISFEAFRPNVKRIYYVLRQITTPYKMNYHVEVHGALSPLMQKSIPEIESFNRVRPGARWIQYGDYAQRRGFWFADANFLSFWGMRPG